MRRRQWLYILRHWQNSYGFIFRDHVKISQQRTSRLESHWFPAPPLSPSSADTKHPFKRQLCKMNRYHPDRQLTARTATEGKREYSVGATAVTIDVSARPNRKHEGESHARTRGHIAKGTQDIMLIKNLMQMMSESREWWVVEEGGLKIGWRCLSQGSPQKHVDKWKNKTTSDVTFHS